jgi:hypothetical protein
MIRYTVVWVQSAQDELAELWLNSKDRGKLADAADVIDRELSVDAPIKGHELAEGLRSLFAPPLKAIFSVSEDDRIAEVLRVWLA